MKVRSLRRCRGCRPCRGARHRPPARRCNRPACSACQRDERPCRCTRNWCGSARTFRARTPSTSTSSSACRRSIDEASTRSWIGTFSAASTSRRATCTFSTAPRKISTRNARGSSAPSRAAGGIDLLVLGIGANGHIGFNEPGAALFARTHRARLTAATQARQRRAVRGPAGERAARSVVDGDGNHSRARGRSC